MAAGFAWSLARAEDETKRKPRVIYPKETSLDADALDIEGEFKEPNDFYFRIRKPEKFDSLVKRRAEFHREMLRDVIMSR